jgi:GTPase SAR1 family protein
MPSADLAQRYKLNICARTYLAETSAITDLFVVGDVGGQKTLRSYWRNYFEKTDALIWVVDATDRLRVDDCRKELHDLLQEEVNCSHLLCSSS